MKKALRLAVVAAVAAASVLAAAPSAHAAPSRPWNPNVPHSLAEVVAHDRSLRPATAQSASAWSLVYMSAYQGGGCAGYLNNTRLEQVVSVYCQDDLQANTVWYVRDMQGNNWASGDYTEWVTKNYAYALGMSGSPLSFKLETPSDTGTLLKILNNNTGWWNSWEFAYIDGGGNWQVPEPAGDYANLHVLVNIVYPNNGWYPCSTATAPCSAGGQWV